MSGSLGGPASGGTVPEAFLGVSCVFCYIMVEENFTDGDEGALKVAGTVYYFMKISYEHGYQAIIF